MAASTGSPASRRSTKLTPLTIRPSLTSRQGITRTLNIRELLGCCPSVADQRQCGGGIKPAIVKCAAGDRASELARAWGKQGPDVFNGGKAAGGNDRNGYLFCQGNRGVQIEPLQQPVTRDVGEDDCGDARILEPPRDFEHRQLRGLRPA